MNQDFNPIPLPIGMILIYVLLGVLGFYSATGIFSVPVLCIPLAIFIVMRRIPFKDMGLMYVLTSVGIYICTGDIKTVLTFIVGIVLCAQMIVWFYRNEMPIPNMIIYGSIIFMLILFIYLKILKGMGVDYEGQIISLLNQMKSNPNNEIVQSLKMIKFNEQALGMDVYEFSKYIIEAVKYLFPTFIFMQSFTQISLCILLFNLLGKFRRLNFPSVKQIFEFRLSKMVVLIFFLGLGILFTTKSIGLEKNLQSIAAELALNIVWIFAIILLIVGILTLIGIIIRSSMTPGFKIVGYIGTFIMTTIPVMTIFFIFFACFDTIFNYRKVKIIV